MNPDTPFSAQALRELKAGGYRQHAQPLQVFEARNSDQGSVTGVDAAAKGGAAGLMTLEE